MIRDAKRVLELARKDARKWTAPTNEEILKRLTEQDEEHAAMEEEEAVKDAAEEGNVAVEEKNSMSGDKMDIVKQNDNEDQAAEPMSSSQELPAAGTSYVPDDDDFPDLPTPPKYRGP